MSSDEIPTDRHGLEVIGLDECLKLLASKPYGRLAYLDAGSPAIVPVNHLVDGSSVVLRSLDGRKLAAAIVERPVAFELDDLDFVTRSGWSVVISGRAQIVEDEDAARFEQWLDSWAVQPGMHTTWVRVVPHEVTGRRLAPTELTDDAA